MLFTEKYHQPSQSLTSSPSGEEGFQSLFHRCSSSFHKRSLDVFILGVSRWRGRDGRLQRTTFDSARWIQKQDVKHSLETQKVFNQTFARIQLTCKISPHQFITGTVLISPTCYTIQLVNKSEGVAMLRVVEMESESLMQQYYQS
jgi:hypothetical protein